MRKEHLPPSRTAEQFVVRFPDGMRDRITEAAKASGRSMNAEIVARLQQSFNLDPMKEVKREELLKLVNDAINERIELENQRAQSMFQASGGPAGARKQKL